jgi:hypothetical protein
MCLCNVVLKYCVAIILLVLLLCLSNLIVVSNTNYCYANELHAVIFSPAFVLIFNTFFAVDVLCNVVLKYCVAIILLVLLLCLSNLIVVLNTNYCYANEPHAVIFSSALL